MAVNIPVVKLSSVTNLTDIAAGATAQDVAPVSGQAQSLSTGGTDNFTNDGKVMVLIMNTDAGGPHTVTFEGEPDPIAARDGTQVVIVAADEVGLAGPFPPGAWNNASGNVVITHDSDALVKLLPFKL